MKRKAMDPKVREAVIERDGHRCVRCGSTFGLACHHRLYRSRGGTDHLFNLITVCLQCHLAVHATSEHPYVVAGSVIRGVYVGPEAEYHRAYREVAA